MNSDYIYLSNGHSVKRSDCNAFFFDNKLVDVSKTDNSERLFFVKNKHEEREFFGWSDNVSDDFDNILFK